MTRIFLLLACLVVAVPSMAQTGHPAKGSWSGDMGPDATQLERLRLVIDAHNGELSATINPGRAGVEADSTELDPETWTLTIRADTPEGEMVLTGTLENLGSWHNRRYRGTYSHGNEMGTFSVTLN